MLKVFAFSKKSMKLLATSRSNYLFNIQKGYKLQSFRLGLNLLVRVSFSHFTVKTFHTSHFRREFSGKLTVTPQLEK